MKPALLLVDLQHDYLAISNLSPPAGRLVAQAADLLAASRRQQIPVVHVWTTVDREPDTRMPHWKQQDRWQCVRGTVGHRSPVELQPVAGEVTVHKRFFSGFGTLELDAVLRSAGVDTVILAGVHLHACVRATALDAYERGYTVWIADDAVASDDPLHAAITRRYLGERLARCLPVAELVALLTSTPPTAASTSRGPFPARLAKFETPTRFLIRQAPDRSTESLAAIPISTPDDMAAAVETARRALQVAREESAPRCAVVLNRLAERLIEDQDWPGAIARETGKPIRYAREEVQAAAAQLRALVQRSGHDISAPARSAPYARRFPLGVVALVTPWNNPLLLPLGKLGAALIHGNTVVWKPAPAASSAALRLLGQLHEAGLAPGTLNVVIGDRSIAGLLMSHAGVDAVTLTGSLAAGYSAQEICTRRHIPLQAELGGNNAAIVWSDTNLAQAAELIAEGAFAMAGQRCTANRRVVVERKCLDEFLVLLAAATEKLPLGDPLDPATRIGPLISLAERARVNSVLDRARAGQLRLIEPSGGGRSTETWLRSGAYLPATIAVCPDPAVELVQEETFGPVLVVQPADDWEVALQRVNGVRQGLVAALFSDSPARQEHFLATARAGVLKINRATAGVSIDLPFGGWKASGIGPPEHGECDREFYTRAQTVYP